MFLLTFLLLAGAVGPAAVASEHKAFTADLSPHSVAAGESVTFTATLTNTSAQQQLGSANITPPAGFTLISTDPQPRVDGTPQGTARIEQNVLELRDLSAPPGAVVTLGFTATTPCDAGSSTWPNPVAKQANNFQGPPGNNLALQAAGSDLSVTVTGGCGVALRFVEGRQPADAVKGAVISSAIGNPSGPAIQVEVIDAGGNRVTNATAAITVAIGADPNPAPGATLSGTTTHTAAGGVATFDDLRIDRVGAGYTLVASSPGLASATSDRFDIWEDIATCDEGQTCTATARATGSMQVTASGRGGPGGGAVQLLLQQDTGFGCGDPFNHAPLVTTLDSTGITGVKTATMTIDKAEVQKFRPNDGAAHYQVCFEADYAFTDRSGQTVTKGLLADCGTLGLPAEGPCVNKKSKTGRGDLVIELRLPAADPRFY